MPQRQRLLRPIQEGQGRHGADLDSLEAPAPAEVEGAALQAEKEEPASKASRSFILMSSFPPSLPP